MSCRCGCAKMRTGQLFTPECSARVAAPMSNLRTEVIESMVKIRKLPSSTGQLYAAPVLRVLGKVGVLTQAGSAGATEVGAMMNPNQMA